MCDRYTNKQHTEIEHTRRVPCWGAVAWPCWRACVFGFFLHYPLVFCACRERRTKPSPTQQRASQISSPGMSATAHPARLLLYIYYTGPRRLRGRGPRFAVHITHVCGHIRHSACKVGPEGGPRCVGCSVSDWGVGTCTHTRHIYVRCACDSCVHIKVNWLKRVHMHLHILYNILVHFKVCVHVHM